MSYDNSETRLGRWFELVQVFGSGHVEIPLCGPCWWRFRVQRFLRGWGWVLSGVLAVLLLSNSDGFGGLPYVSGRAAILCVAVAMGIPYVVFEMNYPRYFDASISDHHAEYVFAKRRTAMDFARLNGSTVQVS